MKPASVEVRTMTVSDLATVMEIADSLPDAPHWPRLTWLEVLEPGRMPLRLALVVADKQANALLGFAVVTLVPPQAELEVIAIASLHQRQGFGRLLLASLVETAKPLGITELQLEVRDSNLAAIGFYHRLGFAQTGKRAGYYADPAGDAILMDLRVA